MLCALAVTYRLSPPRRAMRQEGSAAIYPSTRWYSISTLLRV